MDTNIILYKQAIEKVGFERKQWDLDFSAFGKFVHSCFTIPPSGACIERFFKTCRDFCSPLRGEQKVEKLLSKAIVKYKPKYLYSSALFISISSPSISNGSVTSTKHFDEFT
ncbi:hypothetical protein ADUPG1_012136 [Aduncisulcus paluster]|uniref:HAT C-terminal dimerisation domain-containing protein n=1 Tax=Aduncisulcus paluster TaxID=2918883 RepID=A0ABQ5JYG2_9EUKA|nr:hypothetical protein ADUPG1_012136 [Aduncisulcus paluster]